MAYHSASENKGSFSVVFSQAILRERLHASSKRRQNFLRTTASVLLVYVAPLAGIFGLALLSWSHWTLLAMLPFALLLLEDLRKALRPQ